MKALKVLLIFALVYVGIVVVFESLLGYLQPANESTVVITTTDEDGTSNDRVVSRLDSDGQLYVAANHWPRAWYRQALRNPEVQVTIGGKREEYRAVPVSPAEHDRLMAEHGHGIVFRILTGFPPRYFLRLDPR
ncbi:nitroreductase family deazaflavin-dependent oxidoreductase [Myxococcota bacterium]|nr:nitroreductase family deazaflavin-dependent oxidoreductase [Myxococcota bacterium]MCZ7617679.1 nitroreductase/quinone reductase family protein [Myxococcota bacterium]